MDAYLTGLEQAREAGLDLSTIHSVASFFVSRVDTEVDKRLEAIGSEAALALRGKAAVANALVAYGAFEEVFASDRWRELAAAGANPQRPLWASTGVKNPDYDDTLYVRDLVVAETVNTMPEKTLDAFADHGEVLGDVVTGKAGEGRAVLDRLVEVGIDWDDVLVVLENEGVDKFKKSWDELLETVSGQMEKAAGVTGRARRPDHDRGVVAAGGARRRLRPRPAALVRRGPRAGRAAHLHGRRPARRPVQGPGRRARCWRRCWTLADEVGVAERRDAMFRGEHINVTEDRAVLHTALRLPADATLEVDGQDVVPDVHEVLRRVYDFAEQVRSGAWTGVTGERIRTVVNIGIGGSDLGPGDGLRGAGALPPAGARVPVHQQHRPDRRGHDAGRARPGDHAVHRLQQDLRHPGDADQRAAVQGLAARRARRPGPGRGGGASTSSPSRPRSTRSPTSASTPTTPSASGTGSAAATRSTPRSAPRWSWRSGRSAFAELLAGFHAMDEHFRTTEPAAQRAAADGAAQRLVHQLPRRPDPRRAALRPAAAPLPGVPPAADDGVQRQGRALGRRAGRHRHRRGVLGRAGHQRAARVLPADPPGHPADPGRLHRVRQPGVPADGRDDGRAPTSTSCSSPTSSPRPARWPSARPPTRCAPRAPTRRSCRPGSSPATGRRPRSWRPR